jgi:diacylglycerol kinase family enzyme
MFVLAIVTLVDHLGELVGAVVSLILAVVGAWYMVTRRGLLRLAGTVLAIAALVAAVLFLVRDAALRDAIVIVVLGAIAVVAGRYAVGVDAQMLRELDPPGDPVAPARKPVLLMNPRSGGGKVGTFNLAEEAERRGIEAVVLQPGDDLATLARDAVARGADLLGMAGGDGSQALVAGIASEHRLPFVCIPAGTRNHLALDLGVDRNDVVGSLDAFVDGYERTIDLATVNGAVFVNNVSLGVYARIVQSDEYRDAKVQTTATLLPELLGPDAHAFDFEVSKPDGSVVRGPCLVLVSNNVYELTRLGGFGSRVHLDQGVLGVVTLVVGTATDVARLVTLETAGQINRAPGYDAWTAEVVEVRSQRRVEAGVDGEALVYESPVRFEIRPAALRVRVARHAPGISPAHAALRVRHAGMKTLLQVAMGRPPE